MQFHPTHVQFNECTRLVAYAGQQNVSMEYWNEVWKRHVGLRFPFSLKSEFCALIRTQLKFRSGNVQGKDLNNWYNDFLNTLFGLKYINMYHYSIAIVTNTVNALLCKYQWCILYKFTMSVQRQHILILLYIVSSFLLSALYFLIKGAASPVWLRRCSMFVMYTALFAYIAQYTSCFIDIAVTYTIQTMASFYTITSHFVSCKYFRSLPSLCRV